MTVERDTWDEVFGIKTSDQLVREYLDRINQLPSNIKPEPEKPLIERYGGDARQSPRDKRRQRKRT